MSEELRDARSEYVPLPLQEDLPVSLLARVFQGGNVTASYKFFWFLAILDELRDGGGVEISSQRLLRNMILRLWAPVRRFRLSLGRSDRWAAALSEVADSLALPVKLPESSLQKELESFLSLDTGGPLKKSLQRKLRYVPYRFLSVFFVHLLRGVKDSHRNHKIRDLASSSFSSGTTPALYRFVEDSGGSLSGIELHPRWRSYLLRHWQFLEGFCLWHLLRFLESKNPNVPNLAMKLQPLGTRNLADARKHWTLVQKKLGGLRCLYSGQELTEGFSIDHFLPWSFVAHDQLWNLLPTSPSTNSSKGDSLPSMERYLCDFAKLQYVAVQVFLKEFSSPRNRKLDDYLLLFQMESLQELRELSEGAFVAKLKATLQPQHQIAANMGFSTGWEFKPRQ